MTKQNEPKHEIRVGAVKAAIWESDGGKGPFHTVTFNRLYKTDKGWRRSQSFSGRELDALKSTLEQATAWIHDHEPKS